jgi:dipeptidyl aminopeptidase/acylaminoacyl peptidase
MKEINTVVRMGLVALAIMMVLATGVVAQGGEETPLTFDDFISLGRVSDPQISPDGKHVAFVVTRYSKETNKGNSDIYIMPLKDGEARQLTRSPGTDNSPRFSPDGKWIAFRSTRSSTSQIWVLPTTGGEARQVTELSTGASSPMWMPDGVHIVFRSRVFPDCDDDACNEQRLEADEKDKVEARIYDNLLYRHWDEWRGERRSHIFIVPLDGGIATDLTPGSVDVPTFTLGSSHDVAISPDGAEICVAINRNKNLERNIDNNLYVMPIDGGEMQRVTDNDANDNHPAYSPDGKYIAYRAMMRPGFEADRYRPKLYDRASGETTDLGVDLADKMDRSVRSIMWAPDSKSIYVTCGDLGNVSLYRVEIKNGKTTQLSRDIYVASPGMSPDGKTIVFLQQTSTSPYEVFSMDRKGGRVRQVSTVNNELLARIDMNPLETFTFEGAEGTPVSGFLLKPPGFREGERYPLVFLIHGGPQGAWSNNFHWRWNYQMFAAPGYVVVAINPRGSTGFGQKFTDEITQDWGGKVYEDLMSGLDYVLATYPFIDEERLGAAGASYGGYMINWIEGHSDRFDCLVNHDGVYNFTSFYGTTEELWFPEWEYGGVPWENPDYERYSPHRYAKNFKTPMLVIHGGKDYRVDPSEGFQVFTALQRQGVPSRLLYFPDEGHWVQKPLNAEVWWSTVHEWLAEWLKDDAANSSSP